MTIDWKNKIKDWFKGSYFVLTILLVVSMLGNAYFLYQIKEDNKRSVFPNSLILANKNTEGSSVTAIESPYGVRNEVYSRYEDGKWKTYSTSTPITEKEIKEIRTTINAQHRALIEYFRKQDELMNQFWNSLYVF